MWSVENYRLVAEFLHGFYILQVFYKLVSLACQTNKFKDFFGHNTKNRLKIGQQLILAVFQLSDYCPAFSANLTKTYVRKSMILGGCIVIVHKVIYVVAHSVLRKFSKKLEAQGWVSLPFIILKQKKRAFHSLGSKCR